MMPLLKRFLNSTTTQLASTYLLIIMLMSIGFSIVFYNTSSQALNRQVPPNDTYFRNQNSVIANAEPPGGTVIRDYLAIRADEARRDLIVRLLVINCAALVSGALFSYVLARRSLEPIEEAMEAQAQFVSDASHELRTPLTAIQTSNEVALRNKRLKLDDAKQIIEANTSEVAKLKQLSDGLLALAKNDKTPRQLQAVSLPNAVTAAINQIIPAAQAKNIQVDDQTPKWQVLSSEAAVTQVLVSLLDNAIKYSSPKTTIRIYGSEKANSVFLHVQDEGMGIRASDLPHIFRRFYRADSARNNGHQNGYGLGLAIADSIIRIHGGSLGVNSELDKGSTFSIKFRAIRN